MIIRWFLAAALTAILGCDSPDNTETEVNPASPKLMKVVDFGGWDSVRREHQSQVLVVDIWAMWCVSCIERFPEMVSLHQQFKDQGITFVSLNVDPTDDNEALAEAETFLRQSGAAFEHYHLQENMMAAFEHFNLLGIPAIIFYGREGEELLRLTGDDPNNQYDEAAIRRTLLRLLQSGQPEGAS
ncbi:TlpA family protein disulfide reductase [Pseudomaricurvus alkylphenolicus]|uniref:TlpA family protein disulfide reductase n=1 Tax=Pseudomaricurvus alkylphenolicus TaxID=1306991 RepID=UPI001424551C|nr:TlpA disulfide reductase family protein [Pseudomaricurvus alkylphenolicus]NIB42777.1 TlpA family protein disulfide reductase [Pseudomaricurvus alkylphenolicus]